MKRKISTLLLGLALVLSMAATSLAADGKLDLPVINGGKRLTLSVYSSTPNGMWYIMNSAMATVWQKYIPNLIPRLTPGSGIANCRSIAAGQANFGMTHTYTLDNCMKGLPPFKEKSDRVRIVAALAPTAIQILVPKDSPIKSLADLGDKRLGMSFVGALCNDALLEILKEEYNITPESVVKNGGSVNFLSDGDAAAALQDKQVDMIVGIGSWPKVNFEELALRPGVRMLPIDDAVLKRYVEKYPSWSIVEMSAGTYTGVDYPVKSISTAAVFACDKEMDNDLVYALTKVFWEKLPESQAASSDLKTWTNLQFSSEVIKNLPVHPGAEKYYKEIGAY